MKRKLITCPETAHLEEFEYDETPLGMLIASCTRFHPSAEMVCTRVCAARLDRRDRRDRCGPAHDPDEDNLAETVVGLRLGSDVHTGRWSK